MASDATSPRADVLQQLRALACDEKDATSATAYVSERAGLLERLAALPGHWTAEERHALVEVMRCGDETMQRMQAQQASVAERLRAIRRSRATQFGASTNTLGARRIY